MDHASIITELRLIYNKEVPTFPYNFIYIYKAIDYISACFLFCFFCVSVYILYLSLSLFISSNNL